MLTRVTDKHMRSSMNSVNLECHSNILKAANIYPSIENSSINCIAISERD